MASTPSDGTPRTVALFDQGDEPSFLAAVRDATNGGYALVGDSLKSQLAAAGTRHLERGTPGPRPAAEKPADAITRDLGF